ncbi:hypothetical protein ACFX11_025000 [Malus domestica]
MLLSASNFVPSNAPSSEEAISTYPCFLPMQSHIYLWYLSLFVFSLVSLLLWPYSGVSVWHHCSDLMGIVKQVISSIRSRTKEKIEYLNCVYEMIWDAEGSMHLVKKAIGTSIARSIERNSVESRGNAVLQSAARKNISQDIEVSVNGDSDADSVVDPLAKLLPRASRSRKKTVTRRLVQTLLMVMIIAAVNVPLYVMLLFKD